jgi:hypothetical protein
MSQFTKMMTEDFIYEALRNPLENETCDQLHAGSCNMKGMSQFVEGCKGTYKLYLIVHLIPLLIFKRKKLVEKYHQAYSAPSASLKKP